VKSASTTPNTALPEAPPNNVTGGLDWARDDHAASVVDARGQEQVRHSVEHTAAGLAELVRVFLDAGCREVAIERPDGPETVALRRACRARKDLVRHRVAAANQLRAHLRNVLPGAVGLFAELDSPISLASLTRFSTQDKVDWLSPARLGAWLGKQGYSGRTDPAVLHARLLAAPRGPVGAEANANAAITAAFITVLRTLLDQIKTLSTEIEAQLGAHSDAHILTSLPRGGKVRAARLLGEIGDCRARFPTRESLFCLASVAPSTRQSGKLRAVGFRWACDKQLRDAVIDFAADSRKANPWAADLYARARARGHDHPHAARILAHAWLNIIWHCWQTGEAYDPERHLALQRLLNQAQPEAA
jgi:transposase